jgi:hypothetical protein
MNDAPLPDQPTIPEIPRFPEDDAGTKSVRRRPPTSRTPVVALGIAILLGGGLAWGVVAMIPDTWKLRWKGNADSTSPTQDPESNSEANREPDGPAAGLPDGPVPVIPKRTKIRPAARGNDSDRLDARVARQIEQRAAAMLAEARRLHANGQKNEAGCVLEVLRNRYPGTKAAGDAEKLLWTID